MAHSNAPSLLDPAVLAGLQGLELRARYIVDGYQAGKHRSVRHGHSVEFTEHREYSVGDDLRYVDWKVYAKSDKVYLKQFEAETNLVCNLLVDVSESMTYRSQEAALTKLEYAQCLAASLAYLVLRQGDSASLFTFDREVRKYLNPSNNPAHLRQMTALLETVQPHEKSEIGSVLHQVSRRLLHHGIVVIISDLLGDVDSLASGLKHLRHQKQEVVVLHLLDPAELEFPFRQTTQFRGLESLPQLLTQPRAIRLAYLEVLQEYLGRVQSNCRSLQCDYHLVSTSQPLDITLRRVLRARTSQRGS